MFYNRTIKDYIERLSSDQPTPGGGGTSALVGALGISLIIMVARITANRKQAAELTKLKKAIDHLLRLRHATEVIIEDDPKAFQQVMDSYKQLKTMTNKKIGEDHVETALTKAFRMQADLCLELISAKKLLVEVGAIATKSIRNDLVVASHFLEAAFQGAKSTANINLVYLPKGKKRRHHEHELEKADAAFHQIKFE